MSRLEKNLLLRAAILGATSGMRSTAGPATITRRAYEHPKGFDGTIFRLLSKRPVMVLVTLAQLSEFVIDKLPILPDRISPLPLLGRAFYGGAAAAAAFAEARRPLLLGGAIGAFSAVASAHLFYRLRVGAAEVSHLPDPLLAIAEDGVVYALERAVIKTYE